MNHIYALTLKCKLWNTTDPQPIVNKYIEMGL